MVHCDIAEDNQSGTMFCSLCCHGRSPQWRGTEGKQRHGSLQSIETRRHRALLADELDARYGRYYDIIVTGASVEARAFLSDRCSRSTWCVIADRGDVARGPHETLNPGSACEAAPSLIGWNEYCLAREEMVEGYAR